MSSNNFYSANANSNANANANAQRAPPVPPPRQATAAASARGATAASVRGTTAAKKASRPRQTTYQSNRATAPTVLVGDRNKSSLSGVRKAPVASRPVGSYYNTTSASTAAPTVASTSTNNSAWDDWSSPADTSTATTTATATTNQHSSWAGSNNNSNNNNNNPVTTATTTTNDGDWYSAGGSAATATATTASTGAMYTSSGFNNNSAMQPQSQPQQQQPGSGFYQNNTMSQEQQQQQQQQPFLSGAMDSSAPTMMAMNANNNNINNGNTAGTGAMPSFSMFMPSASTQQQQDACTYSSFEDEAPLLEELGINIQHILLKTKAVVFPFSRFGGDQIDPTVICQDGDLPGPVALLLLLGGEMVLTGKLQFGYIYIYALFGCIAMTLVVNLMSPNDAVSFWTVTSIMGYSLLPVNILALVKIVIMNLIHLQTFGNILGGLTVIWSTVASTRLLELGCGLRSQRYLIAYPLLLFYSAFVMMTIL
jgi:hypothetical protein